MKAQWFRILALCSGALVPAISLARPVSLDFQIRGPYAERGVPVEVRAVLQDREAAAGTPVEKRFDLQAPGQHEIELPTGIWMLAANAQGYWSPEQLLSVEGQLSGAVLLLFRTGTLQGNVIPPRGEEMPESLKIRLRSAPNAEVEVAQTIFSCPVESDGSWNCEIPAGQLDLGIRARGFITHYLWGETIPPGGTHELSPLVLKAGASITGWIEAPTRDFKFEDVTVQLDPRRPEEFRNEADISRRDARKATTVPNSRGFFQFAGLPVGSYIVRARHPDYAVTTISPVAVLERAESEIPSVELLQPVELIVRLQPKFDPYHSSWRVGLAKNADVPGSMEEVGEKAVNPEGMVRFVDLEPGSYSFVIRDSQGSSWTYRDAELSESSEQIDLTLPFVEVFGELLLGDEPIAATLWFGGRHYSRSLVMKSDQEGLFTGYLPLQEVWTDEPQESWRVDIAARQAGIETWFDEVEVSDQDGDGEVTLRLKLPDTHLDGEVVDRNGGPVEGARVEAALDRGFRAVTDEDGRFEFRALPEGQYLVSASHKEQYAEMKTVDVSEDEAASVRLELRGSRKVEGLVVGSSAEGVPGARVHCIIDQSSSRWTTGQPSVVTDAGGQFSFIVPDEAERLLLLAYPFGYTATQLWINLAETDNPIIPVETIGGRLLIRSKTTEPIPQQQLQVFRDGSSMGSPFALTWWAEANGEVIPTEEGVWAFPKMPVGNYTACVGPLGGSWATGRISGDQTHCASGYLSPYSELELAIPVPEPH